MAIKRRLFVFNARQYARLAFVLVVAVIGAVLLARAEDPTLRYLLSLATKEKDTTFPKQPVWNMLPFVLLGALVGGYLGNLFLNLIDGMVERWDKTHTGDRVTLFVGAFVGIITSVPVLLL